MGLRGLFGRCAAAFAVLAYADPVPEGDSLRSAAARLRVLEGQVVAAETPHPRAEVLGIAPRIDGKRLDRVEAVGKNLLFTFDDGTVLRSHLRMRGRWHVRRAGAPRRGTPWLVLRGTVHEAILWNGPVLEFGRAEVDRLGPDIMDAPPDLDAIVVRLRGADPQSEIGNALLDQRIVAGIGNMWRAEGLFVAGVSPWHRLADFSDRELRRCPRRGRECDERGSSTSLGLRSRWASVPALRHENRDA